MPCPEYLYLGPLDSGHPVLASAVLFITSHLETSESLHSTDVMFWISWMPQEVEGHAAKFNSSSSAYPFWVDNFIVINSPNINEMLP